MIRYRDYCWAFVLALLSLAMALLGSYLATHSFSRILTFNQVPFYLDYQEFGFIRRGLVGSVIYFLHQQNLQAILAFSYALIFICALAFWLWIIRCHGQDKKLSWHYLVFLLCPALFLHFGYDLGRTDAFNLLIMITSLYFIERRWYALAGLTSCLAILNHESFLFAHLPVIVAFGYYQLYEADKKEKFYKLGLLFLLPFVADLFITAIGDTDVDMDIVDKILESHLNPGGAQFYFLKFTSIKFNVLSSATNFIGSLRLNLYHLVALVIYLVAFVFYISRSLPVNKTRKDKILVVSCFSPLLLLLLAIDKGRWFAMLIANLCVIYPYLHARYTGKMPAISLWPLAAIIGIGLVLGPMTVSGFHFPAILDVYFIDRRY